GEDATGPRVEHGDAARLPAERVHGGLLDLRVDRRVHGSAGRLMCRGEHAAGDACGHVRQRRSLPDREELPTGTAGQARVERELQAAYARGLVPGIALLLDLGFELGIRRARLAGDVDRI